MSKSKTKFNPSDSTASLDDEFSKERFFSIMDKIDAAAERLGIKINKKAKWIGRTIFFAAIVAVIGTICFLCTFIPKLFKRK